MIITNSSYDEFYYKQLVSFLSSLTTHNKNIEVTVGLVDYPKIEKEKLQQVFKSCTFVDKEVNKLDKRGIHFILLRIAMVLECFDRQVVATWIDTDVVVRGDLSELIKIKPKQFKILCRKVIASEMSSKFNAGVFNIGYSKETKAMVLDWQKRLLKNSKWGMGQMTLSDAVDMAEGIEVVPLGLKFNDLGDASNPNMFADESLLWHSKLNHFNNPKFKKEFDFYFNKGRKELSNVS